jgi:hypothetical protein
VGEFATREEALAVVRDVAATRGPHWITDYWLGHRDPDGRARCLVEGQALLTMASRGP